MYLIMSIHSIYKGLFLHNYQHLRSLLIAQLIYIAYQAFVAFECNLFCLCLLKGLNM